MFAASYIDASSEYHEAYVFALLSLKKLKPVNELTSTNIIMNVHIPRIITNTHPISDVCDTLSLP